MVANQNKTKKISSKNNEPLSKAVLIYNPRAGTKRRILPSRVPPVTLEDIKILLKQYEIPVEYLPTEHPGHATQIAKEAAQKGYKLIIAAGGDGTVGEVVNGLVNTDVTLGILPLGSFMNIASMLSIPTELEKAVQTLKIGRSRKIDVGEVLVVGGKKLAHPTYFVESAGVGLEAQIFGYVQEIERGNYKSLWQITRTYFSFLHQRVEVEIDESQNFTTRAAMITISNGPVMGAALSVAPTAKLNDHRLTVSIYKMSKYELLKHFLSLTLKSQLRKNRKVQIFSAKTIKLKTSQRRLIHADGKFFGETPVEFGIVPNALSVITGFPNPDEVTALIKRTYLES